MLGNILCSEDHEILKKCVKEYVVIKILEDVIQGEQLSSLVCQDIYWVLSNLSLEGYFDLTAKTCLYERALEIVLNRAPRFYTDSIVYECFEYLSAGLYISKTEDNAVLIVEHSLG